MVRKPIQRSQPEDVPQSATAPESQVQYQEREINLSLINDKLNYLIGVCNQIAQACEIDLSK